jgi:hypothetical protein
MKLVDGFKMGAMSTYAGSSAKGRGKVALYNSVSVSKSLTIPSLHPHAMMLPRQLMDDAPVTCTTV